MPKQRQTCTRCSQRRQKCDRKNPCTRCVQNGEGRLCTTKWVDGYDPGVHRKYPRKLSSAQASQSIASSTSQNDSSLGVSPVSLRSSNQSNHTSHDPPSHLPTPSTDQGHSPEQSVWPSRLPEISIGALLSAKDQESQEGPYNRGFSRTQLTGAIRDGPAPTSFLSPAARAVEIQHIQLLLPPKAKVIQIVEYHEKYRRIETRLFSLQTRVSVYTTLRVMGDAQNWSYSQNLDNLAMNANWSFNAVTYWNGGIYHGPTFRKALHDAYETSETSDTLHLHELDWRWTGLLFSILSAGIIGCPEAMSLSWGFTIDDKVRLAREWGAASVSSLNMGNYISQHHICSVQAIYIMHGYEHLVGSTNQWATLKHVAIAIAKGLGLHKLVSHLDDERVHELNPEQKQAFIEREIGRRLWYLLASQEWLCATWQSSNTVGIQKRNFTCARPKYVDEETMLPIDDATPSFSCAGTYFFDYASVFLDFHNAMAEAEKEDDDAKYAKVIKFDGEMRAISLERTPRCLTLRGTLEPNAPKWIAWARRHNQASVYHKIITINQTFLNKSFKDVRYMYSRWACATAAKSIINLYTARDVDEPQQWVEHAFITTAGICLMLDLFHRTEKIDPEAQEYQAHVHKAVNYLQQFVTSSVALHGVRMLLSLQQEYTKMLETLRPNTSHVLGTCRAATYIPIPLMDASISDARTPNTHPLPADSGVPLSSEEVAQFNFDIDAQNFEDLMDYLPVEGGLDNTVFLDSICGLTNQSSW